MSANAVCSGRWPGVCSARTRSAAELELVAVVERLVLVVGRGLAMDVDRRAGRGPQPAVAGDVIGVVVGLEDVLDAHAHVARQLEVLVDLEPRIDHRRHPGLLVADQVGRAAEVVMGDLAEDHRTASGLTLGPSSRALSSRTPSRMPAQTSSQSRISVGSTIR